MTRCRTGWRIYRDPDPPLWVGAWIATHERGLTHYRATFEAAKLAMTRETLRDWERVDGVWREREVVVQMAVANV